MGLFLPGSTLGKLHAVRTTPLASILWSCIKTGINHRKWWVTYTLRHFLEHVPQVVWALVTGTGLRKLSRLRCKSHNEQKTVYMAAVYPQNKMRQICPCVEEITKPHFIHYCSESDQGYCQGEVDSVDSWIFLLFLDSWKLSFAPCSTTSPKVRSIIHWWVVRVSRGCIQQWHIVLLILECLEAVIQCSRDANLLSKSECKLLTAWHPVTGRIFLMILEWLEAVI